MVPTGSRVCKNCETEFIPQPNHQGFVNVCVDCSEGDVDRVMGKVAWSGKHTMEMEITSNRVEAEYFNNRQRRWGAGVIRSITEPKESRQNGENYGKRGTGAEAGALYHSRLGEKRNVKR
jgi:hypothetical protein